MKSRIINPCRCKYRQKDGSKWGYDVARWAAKRKRPWVHLCICPTIKDARDEAAAHPNSPVPIRCRGCGEEILNEQPKP